MALSAHDVADRRTGAAASECLTDEALAHLKTYRYSSVDLSPLSNYVLRHYVRKLVG
jgi:ethanolaminephosphotransferase